MISNSIFCWTIEQGFTSFKRSTVLSVYLGKVACERANEREREDFREARLPWSHYEICGKMKLRTEETKLTTDHRVGSSDKLHGQNETFLTGRIIAFGCYRGRWNGNCCRQKWEHLGDKDDDHLVTRNTTDRVGNPISCGRWLVILNNFVSY